MDTSTAMSGKLVSFDATKSMILQGRCLCIAGDEQLLEKLPKGVWIGGSIPYFMAAEGGLCDQERLYVTEIENFLGVPRISFYSADELKTLSTDAPANGYSIIIIPANSPAHEEYAANAPLYEDMYLKPIVGWISGVHLNDLQRLRPSVMNGQIGEPSSRQAVVMHVELDPNRVAEVHTINCFNQGQGDTIAFKESGFSVKNCLINGHETNFARYLKLGSADTRLPLVADYCGMLVNVSIKQVNEDSVELYAPVFSGVDYRLAQPIDNYLDTFQQALPSNTETIQFSCNCILNYLYSELEGKKIAIGGPMTFGEVAYQLLNQTLVYLTVTKT